MTRRDTDISIVGAGILGLTAARELIRQGVGRVLLLEKESRLGAHASGRNSGVLHAGIYYSPDSMKARSCVAGNRLMRRYCIEKKLPILNTGKVILAHDERELPALEELHRRAVQNGAVVEWIDEKALSKIEPNAQTHRFAIFSPNTAVVDPKKVLQSLQEDIEASGRGKILFASPFLGLDDENVVRTPQGDIRFRYLINTAGAHSDTVAKAFGIGRQYRLIPFKGIYYKLKADRADQVRGSIYPVPDIRNPFLGVHFTRSVYGEVYLGPTAIPAFGRENYERLRGLNRESPGIALADTVLFFQNPKFRSVALTEPRKYFFHWFFNDARSLVKHLDPADVEPSHKVGIRAQLVDWNTKELVQDFCILHGPSSLHLLNPVSPAFTSSMDIAESLVKEVISRLNK